MKTKIVVLLIAISTLSACGIADRIEAGVTSYSKVCVEGVSYLQFTSGATVQYDKSGRVVTCN